MTELTPNEMLNNGLLRASQSRTTPIITDDTVIQKLDTVLSVKNNRSGVRVILACTLAKIHNPNLDITKPYTEIKGDDTYSGRRYDEHYLDDFIQANRLPCNSTTAFLTPAWRNIESPLERDTPMVGRPVRLYTATLGLLNDVRDGIVKADDLLAETIRRLIIERDSTDRNTTLLLTTLADAQKDSIPLSGEDIVIPSRKERGAKRW